MKKFISYIFIVLAAIIDAILDTWKDHFSVSIFKDFNPNFWNPQISWNKVPTILGTHIDSWHLLKFALLGAIFFAVQFSEKNIIKWWANILIYFVIWYIFFELFYSHILIA